MKKRPAAGWLRTGFIVGTAGAVTVLLLDQVLTRFPALARRPGVLAIVRVLGAAGLALGARRLGATETLLVGIVGGPVLFSTLDLGTRLISESRPALPPPAAGVAQLGRPWAPRLTG